MHNSLSWLIISLTVLSITISITYFFREKYDISFCFILLCGFLLRTYVSCDPFLHDWDEKYHALVAKNLMVSPLKPTLYLNPILPYDYTNWTANHIWLHKQPMTLWLISLSLKTFGLSAFSVRIPSILLSTICIWLTFFIASKLVNKRVAVIAAFLFSINGLVIELTGGRVATDHVDIVFLFFVELSVFFSILFSSNSKFIFNVLSGICIGLAILTKWLPALIVLPIWILLVFDSRKFTFKGITLHFCILLITIIIVSLPWQIYIHYVFPKEAFWETSFNFRHFTEVIENQTGSSLYFINKIRINYGELIYLPLIWFITDLFQKPNNLKRIALFIWFIVPLIFFSIAKTKMQAYLLFVCPAFFIISADFCQYLSQKDNRKLKWLFNILIVLILAIPIRYCLERLKPFEVNRSKNNITTSIIKLKLRKFTSRDVLFNCDHPIEVMFYTKLTTYKGLPDVTEIEKLIKDGYNIYINNHQSIPNKIEKVNGIKLINLGF